MRRPKQQASRPSRKFVFQMEMRSALYLGALVATAAVDSPLGAREADARAADALAASTQFDWPRWRGPNFDGISPEREWSSDWPERGPPVLWKKDIGVGFSSFSVFGGRIYTMGSVENHSTVNDSLILTGAELNATSPDKDEIRRRDVIWCLNADTGEEIWTHEYPAKLIDILHEGGPSATPTLHQGRGYTVSKEGHFVCFEMATGKVLWHKELVEQLNIKMPVWGFSGSSLIFDDLVIVEAGKTVAFNRLTGRLVWQTEEFRAAYSSPVSFTDPQTGDPMIASLNNDVLLILRPDDGSEVARYPFVTSHPTNSCTPIICQDTLFLSSGYNRGCTLLKLTAGRLEKVYDNRNMRNHMNSCVLHDGYLYGFDGNSHSRRTATLKCIDYATGEIMWKERGYGVGSLMLAGDRLIALSDRGKLLVVRPTPEKLDLVASAQVIDGKCWTPPALCYGKLYVRNAAGKMICLDLRLRNE